MSPLPEDWTEEPFEQVATYDTGRTPARAKAVYWEGAPVTVPWVSIADMEPYGTLVKTKEGITATAFDEVFRRRMVPAGTLLMSFKLTIGRVATLGVAACHNEAIISIHPRDGVNQAYLGYFLSQVDYADHQDRQVKGNTLNQDKINRIPVVLPPKPEQDAMAAVLDTVRSAIATERAAETATRDLKRAAMRDLFARGLRGSPQVETEHGLFPETWERRQIGSLGTVVTGTTPPTKDTENYIGGQIPFLAPGDIEHGALIESSEKRLTARGLSLSRSLPAGSTCFVCIGSTIGKVGITTTDVCATNQQINAIVPSPDFDARFVFHLMTYWSDHVRRQSSPSPVPILSKGAFEQIEVLTSVDLEEQRGIAGTLDVLNRKIAVHRLKALSLDAVFDILLRRLMAGGLRTAQLDLTALGTASTEGPTS